MKPTNANLEALTAPLFTSEGQYKAAFQHNAKFAKPSPLADALAGGKGPYQTALDPQQERRFRVWVAANKVPFDPNASTVDYDMRGYWLARQQGGSQARAANGHFPDTFKTPYDTTFSNESRYATKNNPFVWVGNSLIDGRTGQLVFR